jgi:hypothetical protein
MAMVLSILGIIIGLIAGFFSIGYWFGYADGISGNKCKTKEEQA